MRIGITPLLLTLAAAAVPAGCAGSPSPADLEMKALIVDEQGIHPAPEIELEQFGTVSWVNGFHGGQTIRVTVDRPVGPSEPCSTRLGFEDRDGKATSPELAGNHVGALCFHDSGTYGYEVQIGARRLTGKIIVERGAR